MAEKLQLDTKLYTRSNALISVSDKEGVVEFADGLHQLGWNIIASTGTKAAILAGKVPVTDTAELTGSGAFLNHKVVTLSQEIGAGLLADPTDEGEVYEMAERGIPFIDLLAQNSYPLRAEIAKPDATEASVRAQTDIGGPTMLREAAKGRRPIAYSPKQYGKILQWLADGRPDNDAFIDELVAEAKLEAAAYAMEDAIYAGKGRFFSFTGVRSAEVAYGENHYQNAAIFTRYGVEKDPLAITSLEQQKGMELSYNNYVDFERAFQTMTHVAATFDKNFDEQPAIAIAVKHGNACGAAYSYSMPEAIMGMIEGDTRAIHGGVITINGELNEEIAELLVRYAVPDDEKDRLLDAVGCATVTPGALEILSRKKLRVVTAEAWADLNADSLDTTERFRYIRGGVAVQDNYTHIHEFASEGMDFYGRPLALSEEKDLAFAAAIGQTSNSNTITIVKNGKLLGNGIGQQDRVGAAQTALGRTTVEPPLIVTNHHRGTIILALNLDMKKLHGSAVYSDSFQPFKDSAELLVKAGIGSILTSKAGVQFKEVMEVYANAGVAVAVVPESKYAFEGARGFYGH